MWIEQLKFKKMILNCLTLTMKSNQLSMYLIDDLGFAEQGDRNKQNGTLLRTKFEIKRKREGIV